MSVRKRAWTTAKGEKREAWIVDYRDSNGARALQTFDRKKDADAFWASVQVDVSEGDLVAPSKSEMVKDAAERWIKRVEADGAEPTTIRQYRQHINLHIVPRIGGERVATLTETRLEKFRDDLLQNLSRPLARKVLVSAKSILRTAKRGHIAANVKIKTDKRKKKLELGVDIPTPAEIQRILRASDGAEIRVRALMATAIFTGLRSSELLGLRWSDVDFKNSELHVRQRADREGNVGRPKSRPGTRSVDFGPKVRSMLMEWKLACPKGEGDLVFPRADGSVWDNKELHRKFEPVMTAAGLIDKDEAPKYGPHSLRHYFASWAINRKADGGRELPAKNVQELLGHSSIMMTLDLYGHLFPRGNDRTELAAAEAALWG